MFFLETILEETCFLVENTPEKNNMEPEHGDLETEKIDRPSMFVSMLVFGGLCFYFLSFVNPLLLVVFSRNIWTYSCCVLILRSIIRKQSLVFVFCQVIFYGFHHGIHHFCPTTEQADLRIWTPKNQPWHPFTNGAHFASRVFDTLNKRGCSRKLRGGNQWLISSL